MSKCCINNGTDTLIIQRIKDKLNLPSMFGQTNISEETQVVRSCSHSRPDNTCNVAYTQLFTCGDLRRIILIRLGILFALGVAVHNLPVGLAIGAGLFNEPRVGIDLATIMLLHNFPEGLAISLPMVFANVNRIFIPVTASIVAIPSGIGSFMGYSMGNLNPNILSFLFGIAIGAIFYVTWHEIAARSIKRLSLVSFSLCLGAGVLIGKLFSILA